jgi:hypothetical protein
MHFTTPILLTTLLTTALTVWPLTSPFTNLQRLEPLTPSTLLTPGNPLSLTLPNLLNTTSDHCYKAPSGIT